jgi:hypothetical protein
MAKSRVARLREQSVTAHADFGRHVARCETCQQYNGAGWQQRLCPEGAGAALGRRSAKAQRTRMGEPAYRKMLKERSRRGGMAARGKSGRPRKVRSTCD